VTRTVVVTGAARGIGAGIAARFVDAGWQVVLVDVSMDVTYTAASLGTAARAVAADLASPDGGSQVAAALQGEQVHALVNNAGITRDAMIKKMAPDQFTATTRVNLGGPIRLIDALLPLMPEGSTIVNVSSKSASGNIGQYNYALSKAGLLGYTRALARIHAPRVRVNAISPGFIATEMTDAIPDDLRANILAKIPMARPGLPKDIADVALWLSSEESSYVTGQVLAVCGGRTYAP
jgi:NAD(P)-dependent dehydrogenase (short-subunit alcohol dehydrogenase family)